MDSVWVRIDRNAVLEEKMYAGTTVFCTHHSGRVFLSCYVGGEDPVCNDLCVASYTLCSFGLRLDNVFLKCEIQYKEEMIC